MRHTIGRLEGQVESLAEGQRESKEETRNGFAEVSWRIDRLFYAILAIGGGLVAAVLADRFISAS